MNQTLNKTNAAIGIDSVINDTYGEMPSHRFVHTFGFEHRHNINGKRVNFDDLKQKISDKLGVPVKSYKAVMYAETSNGHVYVHHAAGTVKDGFLSVQTFKPSGYENELPPFKNSRRDSIVEAYMNQSPTYLNQSPTIEVDGVIRHRNNSDGQPIHPTDEGIRNFHRWFGDSHVTEEVISSKQKLSDLRPLVLYHGTRHDFDTFRPTGIGTVSHTFGDYQTKRHGIFLTPHRDFAESFATQGEQKTGSNVMPVYASIKNPLYIRNGFQDDDIEKLKEHGISERFMRDMRPHQAWEHFDDEDGEHLTNAIKSAGYDGVFMSEDDPDSGESRDTVIAFNPNQIKSALGNNGNFSSSNKITESIDPIAKAYIQLKEESEFPQHLLSNITASGRYSIDKVSPLSYGNGYEVYYSANKPESAVSYGRYKNPRRNKGESWYNPTYATLEKQNEGESFESQSPVLKPEFSSSIKTNPDSGLLYRGISAEEFESIKNTGKIKSRGDYNLEGQEGLTYFSTDPTAAQHYAHSFAPLHFKATHDKPAYVIGVRNPGTGVKIAGTGEHEVGIPHEIDASEIQEIHRGIPYSAYSGSQEYMKEWGDKEFKPTSSSAPSTHLVWERIK